MLLKQFAATDSRDFLPVLIGPEHNDPTVLAKSIADAMDPVDASAHDEFLDSLLTPQPNVESRTIPKLLQLMATRSEPFILSLDEVEHVTSADGSAILAALATRMPTGSQLALASRADPPIPLGLMRARREIIELRQEQLMLTKRESADLLGTIGVELEREQLDAIVRKTDGWAAAVYLAGIAIDESRDQGESVERFAGDDRVVVDYLREQFLSSLSSDDLELLRDLSILDPISGRLAESVSGQPDASSRLRAFASSNLLFSAIDRRGEWYRFHPLLRDALLAELRLADQGLEVELNLSASHWWEGDGDVDRAIDHAVAAKDPRRAGELLWSAVATHVSRGQIASVIAWQERLGVSVCSNDAGLALSRAAVSSTMCKGADADHWIGVARSLVASEPDSDRRRAFAGGVLLMDAVLSRNGLTPMREAISLVDAELPEEDPWRALCALLDGTARFFQGETDPAITRLREGVRRGSIGAPNVQILCHSQLAVMCLESGDTHAARTELEKARAQVDRCGLREYPVIALYNAASSLVNALIGRTDASKSDLDLGNSQIVQLDNYASWYEAETRLLLARAAHRLDRHKESRALLRDASTFVEDVPDAPQLRRIYESIESEITASRAESTVELTPAEVRVLQQLNSHLSMPAIAKATFVSTNTVKSHARSIYKKLDASSRSEAVENARQFGLLD